MAKIIPAREEYTLERVEQSGYMDLFLEFQRRFSEYVGIAGQIGRSLITRVLPGLPPSENPFLDFVKNTPNFNRYVGDLEKVCDAAQKLEGQYDLGIGVAKKGLWSSFVFNLHGLPTRDVLVMRLGEGRFMLPISPLYRKDIEGKRILLFDNDLVTGRTIEALVGNLKPANPRSVDLLLIYGYPQFEEDFYGQVKDLFPEEAILGKTDDGKIVLDTSCNVPDGIDKAISLEVDFEPSKKNLVTIASKLGVNLK